MQKLCDLSALMLRNLIVNKDISPIELLESCIERIRTVDGPLNAFITDNYKMAKEEARRAEKAVLDGDDLGILHGIPVGIKDLEATAGIRTTFGSLLFSKNIPKKDQGSVANVRAAGGIILGKTNTPEFGAGGNTRNLVFGATKNPFDITKTCGGSSGGSAVALSAGMVPLASGSDYGGSLRTPASFCGVVGIKPTYGRCSRWGIIAFASSLDQAGPITKTVNDSALMLNVMSGFDPKDSTSANNNTPDFLKACGNFNLKNLKVGIPKEYQISGMSSEIINLWETGYGWLKDRGADIIEVSLPHTKYALPTYYVIAPAEASSNLARYDGVKYGYRNSQNHLDDLYANTRADGFGNEVKRRILIGTYVLSAGYYDAYYRKAQRVRNLIIQDFNKVFKDVDVILTPTTPSAAFEVGSQQDPISMYMNDVFTVPASLAGLPAMSVPSGLSTNGLPLGLQIIGKQFDEENVLKVASNIEDQAKFPFLN